MIELQNNFTTPEQSKRLLELGVPADSADCVQFQYNVPDILHTYYSAYMKCLVFTKPDEYTPCWSAGRLIEIFELCTGRKFIRSMDRLLVEDIKCRVALYIHHHKFDFSKLED